VPYHHGDLRRAIMDTALAAVAEHGPVALSLRDVARRAGVSHAAPTHHFGDKAGLLTALATEGWTLLGDALEQRRRDSSSGGAGQRTGESFAEMGVAYVVFATSHPAHFAVMRAPGLVRGDDPELAAAGQRAADLLQQGAGQNPTTALAGWALVHGLSTLLLDGMVAPQDGGDVESLARSVTGRLG
jgi:AcrR family transcriptional regulator